MTYKKFELLRTFMMHPGMAFTRENLYTGVWNMDYLEDSRTLDMHIRTLQVKLGPCGKFIETGLVKPEDISRFAQNIRSESGRLADLIDDIIRFSQMDEGISMPREQVDLSKLAKETFFVLQNAAALKNVHMSASGNASVRGVKSLLTEMLYNLCDNAIKYNVSGGKVTVTFSQMKKEAVITIEDTGFGIPPLEQNRVFERFCRVDKSHSKKSGGTGLGLFIVKHTVMYYGGKISLQSKEGIGTAIMVALPRKNTP